MSEQVQAALDQMIPALRDLMNSGIFSEAEVQAIVTRRRESEYLIRRRVVRKSDYMQYIHAEYNLERLRLLRKKKLNINKDKVEQGNNCGLNDKYISQSTIGDASIIQLIHLLFIRAKYKWRDDLSWHIQHAEFAKEVKSSKMLGVIYAEALQLHPRNAAMWIEAASHEYFGYNIDSNIISASYNKSIDNARVLLQRGLRINPKSEDLWLQLFSLELHYTQKLSGLDDKKEYIDFDYIQGDDYKQPLPRKCSTHNKVQTIFVVFSNAIVSIPMIVKFRLNFLDLCEKFPHTHLLQNYIMKSIQKDFPNNVDAWISITQHLIKNIRNSVSKIKIWKFPCTTTNKWLYNSCVKKFNIGLTQNSEITMYQTHVYEKGYVNDISESLKVILHVLNNAIDTIKTPLMYIKSIHCIRWYMNLFLFGQGHEYAKERFLFVKPMSTFLSVLFQKANENRIFSSQIFSEKAMFLIEKGRSDEATLLLSSLVVTEEHSINDSLWIKLADIKTRHALLNTAKSNLRSISILQNALDVIPINEGFYWNVSRNLYLNLLINSSFCWQKCNEEMITLLRKMIVLFQQSFVLSYEEQSDRVNTIAEFALLFLFQASVKSDFASARKVYREVLFNSNYLKSYTEKNGAILNIMKTFFDVCLYVENMLISSNSKELSNLSVMHKIVHKIINIAVLFFNERGCVKLANYYQMQMMLTGKKAT